MDLSLLVINELSSRLNIDIEKLKANLLADDTVAIFNLLSTKIVQSNVKYSVDFILDNSGMELVTDLAFADWLIQKFSVFSVRFHCKSHPFFVSDSMKKDIMFTIDYLIAFENSTQTSDEEVQNVHKFGRRLKEYLDTQRLQIIEHWVWTSTRFMYELPTDLLTLPIFKESPSIITFFKGDANYRRLVGDRHWKYTKTYQSTVCYLQRTPFWPAVALRTLKADVVVGLQEDVIEKTKNKDPKWLNSGHWGVIQLAS